MLIELLEQAFQTHLPAAPKPPRRPLDCAGIPASPEHLARVRLALRRTTLLQYLLVLIWFAIGLLVLLAMSKL